MSGSKHHSNHDVRNIKENTRRIPPSQNSFTRRCRPGFEAWQRRMSGERLRRFRQLATSERAQLYAAPGPDGKPVVLKVFLDDDEAAEHSMQREAAALLHLRNAAVGCVAALLGEVSLHVSVPALALEYVPPARDEEKPGKPEVALTPEYLGEPALSECKEKVLAAFQATLGAGVVHGDVAHRNVLLTRGPGSALDVKIIDWAMATVFDDVNSDAFREARREELCAVSAMLGWSEKHADTLHTAQSGGR